MNVAAFIAKWSKTHLSERAASQEHFLDLCHLVGVKTPAELDPVGDTFTFEKGVQVSGPASIGSKGSHGWADAWYKGRFAWEYKRQDKHKTLEAAYQQLQQYREDLENPPLLVVSDITHTEIHTNFTGFKPEVYTIELAELDQPEKLDLLRRLFTDPQSFKPTKTIAEITEEVAANIGSIAQSLRDRGNEPHVTAHFLMKCMFCLFAEDVDLLPRKLFERLLKKSKDDPPRLKKLMDNLFDAMRTGGDFGVNEIAYFNGGLFDHEPAIELTCEEADILYSAAIQQWAAVEPSIFGTLFERSLDPAKRSQIGAHYTSREDIMLVVEPVIVRPLRKMWGESKAECEKLAKQRATTQRKLDKGTLKKGSKLPATFTKNIEKTLFKLQEHIASVRVLDPACGSGNFLYVAIQQLLGLEKEIVKYAADLGTAMTPRVRPTQLLGIEINPYASELAQVVIWIGYLQWMRDNGFNAPRNPILEPIDTIENRDAILSWEDEEGQAISVWREGAKCRGQAEWPEADFIVGNPPFLGTKLLRRGLGDEYVLALFETYKSKIPNFSDLCCYWFELARKSSIKKSSRRVGLIATQGIRGKDSRRVLDRILKKRKIIEATSDREWMLDGANVHVSIVVFGTPLPNELPILDHKIVPIIHSTLTTGAATGHAKTLDENENTGFVGDVKAGKFDIEWTEASVLLALPTPNGKPPHDVLIPWWNGTDLTRRCNAKWIIDFGSKTPEAESSCYGEVFEIVKQRVKPARDTVKRRTYRENWWLHAETCQSMRERIWPLNRFLITACTTKYRLFGWGRAPMLPDHALIAFARSDDYFFGVLHSSVHELWARRQGTQLREAESGFRYTPTTCFETFPLPWSPGAEPSKGHKHRPLHDAIGKAAKELNEQRERWLNPPEWVAQIAAAVDAEDDFADVLAVSGAEAHRLIRQSAIDAASAKDKRLKKRTLTKLYNDRPTWLKLTHKALDEAVLAAYAAVDPKGSWDGSQAAVFEETGAGQALPETAGAEPDGETDCEPIPPTPHPLAEKREEVEQQILGDLLRMNLARAGED